jgi:hypothetical protein
MGPRACEGQSLTVILTVPIEVRDHPASDAGDQLAETAYYTRLDPAGMECV